MPNHQQPRRFPQTERIVPETMAGNANKLLAGNGTEMMPALDRDIMAAIGAEMIAAIETGTTSATAAGLSAADNAGNLTGNAPRNDGFPGQLLDPAQLDCESLPWGLDESTGYRYINDPTSSTYPEALSDFPQLHRTHHTSGYRDGLSVSRADSVQSAFDAAFPKGMAYGLRAGKVLGCIEFALAGDTGKNQLIIIAAARRELNMNELIPDVVTEIMAGCPGYSGWPTDDIVVAAWAQAAGDGDGTSNVYPGPNAGGVVNDGAEGSRSGKEKQGHERQGEQQLAQTHLNAEPHLPPGLLVIRQGPPANIPGYRGYASPASNIGEAILRWELMAMDFVNFRQRAVDMGIIKKTGARYC